MEAPAGARPRPASALEGSRLCGKGSSSPDPESGGQWTPFGKVNLVLGGKRTQGTPKTQRCVVGQHMSVCVFVYAPPCLCVCRHCLWSRSLLVYRPLLSSDLLSFSHSSLICLLLLISSRVSVNRRTVVGATDESGQGYTLANSEGLTISEPQ